MHGAPQHDGTPPSKYVPVLVEAEQPKRNKGVVKPIPVEQLVNLKLFANNAPDELTTWEKFIGHKVKTA